MSKNNLVRRLRTNPDYKYLTRWLDKVGLDWNLVKRNSKGHPELMIEKFGKEPAYFTISSTPAGGANVKARLAQLKRVLKAAEINFSEERYD